MSVIDTRVWVKDIDQMVAFYCKAFQAELLDQTETSAYLKIDEDTFEFILGLNTNMHSIAIQFVEEKDYQACVANAKQYCEVTSSLSQRNSQNVYQSRLKDVEDNMVSLYHYQLYVPASITLD